MLASQIGIHAGRARSAQPPQQLLLDEFVFGCTFHISILLPHGQPGIRRIR
jgi:hypothetical protein